MNQPYLKKLPSNTTKNLLENNIWSDGFAPLQLDILSHSFQAYSAPSTTAIFKEGQTTDFFALLCSGLVDVTKEAFSGSTKVLQTIGPGKAIGEMSFFDNSPCSANVIVKEEAALLVLDKTNYADLVEHSPRLALEISTKVIHTISARLRQTSGRLIDLI